MPRIDPYEQRTNVSGLPSTPHISPAAPGAAALEKLGTVAESFANKVESENERARRKAESDAEAARKEIEHQANLQAAADVHDQIVESQLHLLKTGDDLKTTMTGDPSNYAATIAAEAKVQRDKILKNTTNPKAKIYAQEKYSTMAGTVMRGAVEYQFLRQKEYNGQQFDNSVKSEAEIVATDSSQYSQKKAEGRTRAELAGLGPGLTEKARDKSDHALRVSATEGDLIRNPAALLAALNKKFNLAPDEGIDDPSKPPREALEAAAKEQQAAGKTEFSFNWTPPGAKMGNARMYKVAEVLNLATMPGGDLKPRIQNADGTFSTEQTITIEVDGRHVVIPTIVDGKKVKDDEAAELYRQGKNKSVGEFATQVEADTFAESRTHKIGEINQPGKTGVPHVDDLTTEEAVKYRNQAIADLKSGNANAKAEIGRRMQDGAAMALDGKKDPNPITPAQVVAAYGPDAPRIMAEVRRTEVLADDIAANTGKSKGEIVAGVEQAKSTLTGTVGEGYAHERDRVNIRAQAGANVIKAREDDAAAWVNKNVQSVGIAYAAAFAPGPTGMPKWLDPTIPMAERRAAMTAFTTGTLAEQTRLGIDKVSVLPDSVKGQIAQLAQHASGSGDKMAANIQQMSEVFGDEWPRVYKEVLQSSHAKQVPPSFIVIPAIPKENVAAREEIARLDAVKVEELRVQTPKGTEKDITEGIQAALAPWAQSMMGNKTNTQTYEAVRLTVEKLAYSRVIYGKSPSDAVREATDTIVGQYEFPRDHSSRPYAVPKTENPAQVRDGVDAVMKRLPALNLTPPPDATKMRTPAEAQLEFVSAVRARPLWVTNDKEDGLLLYTQGQDGRPIPVMGPDNKQLEMKFGVLRAYAAEEKAASAPTMSPTGRYGAPGQILNRYQTENERAAADALAFRERQKPAGQ